MFTTDAVVEGVHFDRRFSALADVGYKALAVNVSDLAAMGAQPEFALLSLLLPDGTSLADVDALLDGLLEMAAIGALMQALESQDATRIKPVNVTVDYMRGGTDRDTFATAEIQRLGTRIANVEATAWQTERSSPIATARLNFLLERP